MKPCEIGRAPAAVEAPKPNPDRQGGDAAERHSPSRFVKPYSGTLADLRKDQSHLARDPSRKGTYFDRRNASQVTQSESTTSAPSRAKVFGPNCSPGPKHPQSP